MAVFNPFAFLAYKKFPTPLLKPYWPFMLGMAATAVLINQAKELSQDSDEFINHPKHPRFAKGGKVIDLENRD
ncbi:hypothetical protein BABINDRAFT_38555 [Babjeviella inositovora NRRL Y-12698]|uniref:ATP synthase subunit J, mitochondrial n=1 Tax=Babjeviella inositovora NRRL Y-12698 TaxID=984486 RepID=A0A1E3QM71_9ASCO|nr:uncharacterized protein BABINDRAFT_38555 [Babjeviella inositovora NRRL Y-12698]ODQ78781.1 hypothetical protein BABINDRAFT_38555 [Babjeviella inositovora NRRL Y-12698]